MRRQVRVPEVFQMRSRRCTRLPQLDRSHCDRSSSHRRQPRWRQLPRSAAPRRNMTSESIDRGVGGIVGMGAREASGVQVRTPTVNEPRNCARASSPGAASRWCWTGLRHGRTESWDQTNSRHGDSKNTQCQQQRSECLCHLKYSLLTIKYACLQSIIVISFISRVNENLCHGERAPRSEILSGRAVGKRGKRDFAAAANFAGEEANKKVPVRSNRAL